MSGKSLARVGLIALLPLATGACGFVFMHGPPEQHEQLNRFNCTESNTGAILDFVWAGLNVVGAAAVAADADNTENSGGIIVSGIAWGAFSTAAGVVGMNKTKKCRAAKQQLADRQTEGLDPPAPTRAYWGPVFPQQFRVDTAQSVRVDTAHSGRN